MSPRKTNLITVDNLNSKTLYITINALVIISFIVRLKVFNNFLNYDMSIIAHMPNFYTHYKLIGLIIVSIALILSLAYGAFRYKQNISFNYVLICTSLIIIIASISTLMSEQLNTSIWGFYTRTNGLLTYVSLFLIIYCISNLKVQTKHIAFLIQTLNIASIVFVIIGIFQFFGLEMMNSLWFKQIYVPNEYKHLIDNINIASIAFYGSPYYWASSILAQFNYFGAYCSIIYPIVTAFALNEDSKIKKTLLIIGSIMLFTGTLLAQSMGSITTMFLVLLLTLIAFVNKHNYKSFLLMCAGYTIISVYINKLTQWMAFSEIYKFMNQVLSSKLIVPIILASIIYVLLFIFRKRIVKYRYLLISILIILLILVGATTFIYVINNVVEQNMAMLSGRGYIWHHTNEIIKENLLFGLGPDTFFYNFPQTNPNHSIYMPGVLVDKPHNMYLQIISDIGIIGFAGFMLLLVGLLLKLNKNIDLETDVHKNTYSKALILVILAYMIQGLVNDNHLVVQPILYLMLGIGAAITNNVKIFNFGKHPKRS